MSRAPPPTGYRNMSNGSTPSFTNSSSTALNSSQTRLPRPHSPNTSSSSMSRAERFEDEKRRIIESCFSKLDPNGQLAESYITHIRIQEDAAYPSAPPPPESKPDNKKPRLIIIAVRSTGRVRMHKARENNNGSFSIGKTWNLEEMSGIESFSPNGSVPAATEKEARERLWAGSVGFVVTITKPYYWQAGTSKEKDFFIASAVKIFRKYTKGQVPELKGFEEKERAMMLGVLPGQLQGQQGTGSQQQLVTQPPSQAPVQREPPVTAPPPQQQQIQPMRNEIGPPEPPQPAFAKRDQSRDESRYRGSPGPPPSVSDLQPPGALGSRQPSASPARPSRAGDGPVRPFASQEGMRAQSREGFRGAQQEREFGGAEGGRRPGTSPAPSPGLSRGPQLGQPFQSPPPVLSQRASQSRLRPEEGPAVAPGVAARAQSPLGTQGGYQPPPPLAGQGANGTGPALFEATRQRWMGGAQPLQQPQQQPQPYQPHALVAKTPSPTTQQAPPQLPPIETSSTTRPWYEKGGSQDPTPITATSSAGHFDLGDAAAVGAITAFWGDDEPQQQQQHQVTPTIVQEPASPATPERSARRQQVARGDSFDLRPAPLAQAQQQRTPEAGSAYTTPLQSEWGTPRPEEAASASPVVAAEVPKPLSPQRYREAELRIPGAFENSPLPGASPLRTPAVTPSEEEAPAVTSQQAPPPAASDDTAATDKENERQRQEEEEAAAAFRPGLGPMIKKNAIRDRFKKAAITANAFKPRPGGAAEKILKAKAERESGVASPEPDGITGVVPRPGTRQGEREEGEKEVKGLGLEMGGAPNVEVTSPVATPDTVGGRQEMDGASRGVELTDEAPAAAQLHLQTPELQQHQPEEEEEDRPEQREVRKTPQLKPKRRSGQQEKYLAALGIERSFLEGRGAEFELLLTDFGWKDSVLQPKQLAELETDLRRERSRLEAGSWLSHADSSREDKVAQVDSLLDKAIAECDELEGLLTLYNVELSSLNDDIAFIEAQSQGLQVQSANQKLLYNELASLVETLSLDRRVLEPLQYGDLSDARSGGGLEEVEQCLGRLWQAFGTLEPGARRPKSRSEGEGRGEVSSMKALREKREVYERESGAFCQRLMGHLEFVFGAALGEARGKMARPTSSSGTRRLNKDALQEARRGLWTYSPLILFTKELSPPAWQTALRMYYSKAQPLYAEVFRENIGAWKKAARKPGAEEAEALLFTTQEKDEPSSGVGVAGLGAATRKLTVKRSATLAKTLRNVSGGEKHGAAESTRSPGSSLASEVFAGAMDEMAPLISQEQNFVVELFHASSVETADFLELVSATPPAERHGTNILIPKPMDPDREMARRVTGVMDEVFGFFSSEMSSMLEWSIVGDPIQGVGVMACLSRHAFFLQETSQEFLLQLVESLATRLQGLWAKFVDDQVRAIEDTKVKSKKRRGVIGFMKTFPHFSAAVETVFSAVAQADYEGPADCMFDVRKLVDEAYARLNRAMFDSLKVIAKESPGHQGSGGGKAGDEAEDKEMLNFHVLLIENMNHYIEEVDDGEREGVLAEWRGRAMLERAEALEAYVGRVIRRPLGKLLVCSSFPPLLLMLRTTANGWDDRTSSTP